MSLPGRESVVSAVKVTEVSESQHRVNGMICIDTAAWAVRVMASWRVPLLPTKGDFCVEDIAIKQLTYKAVIARYSSVVGVRIPSDRRIPSGQQKQTCSIE